MVLASHFSSKTLKSLSRKGVEVIGTMAVPAFEGDVYFSGTAYQLKVNGGLIIRTHSQVVVMGSSSWTPEFDPELNPDAYAQQEMFWEELNHKNRK